MSSLSRAEHEVMLAAKMMLMRRMTDNLADKVYLHTPARLPGHQLSVFKIN